MFLPLRVVFEDIETILRVYLIIQTNPMRDLIFFFDEVQLFPDGGVVLVPVLTDLEQHLNHILDSLIDVCLVQDIPELVKHRQCDRLAHLFQMLAHFPGQAHGDLHTVICRLM